VASRGLIVLCAALAGLPLGATSLRAETLMEALAAAYANNATLNASRAQTRAADEGVPKALSGYRPQIAAFAQTGIDSIGGSVKAAGQRVGESYYYAPLVVGVQITQSLYAGGTTENSVKQAEALVRASRQQLRYQEQNTLLGAATAYMDVIATKQLLDLRKSNVDFLKEQVRAASDRFSVGEGTRTDVSQAQAALAAAQAQVSLAQSNALAAVGNYLGIVGHKPGSLAPAAPIAKLIPSSLNVAIDASRKEHPAIQAAVHNADAAGYQVQVAQGALLPQLSVTGTVQQSWSDYNGYSKYSSAQQLEGSVMGKLTIPIYQGGGEYASVRQAKEAQSEAKIQVDAARDSVNTALMSAWGAFEAARAEIDAAKAGVDASKLALDGVIEEQKVGQRTTLDVLNSQSTLINAKVSLVGAQRDAVVASYSILSAMGRLDREHIGLKVAAYKPEEHYNQVRDAWGGLRTPDGH
jgi:outer membrane protein